MFGADDQDRRSRTGCEYTHNGDFSRLWEVPSQRARWSMVHSTSSGAGEIQNPPSRAKAAKMVVGDERGRARTRQWWENNGIRTTADDQDQVGGPGLRGKCMYNPLPRAEAVDWGEVGSGLPTTRTRSADPN